LIISYFLKQFIDGSLLTKDGLKTSSETLAIIAFPAAERFRQLVKLIPIAILLGQSI